MADIDKIIDEQVKKLSQADTKEYAKQLIKQKELARQRSKINAQRKKEAGIKQLLLDLPEVMFNEFKNLMQITGVNKTTLFANMLTTYKQIKFDKQDEANTK